MALLLTTLSMLLNIRLFECNHLMHALNHKPLANLLELIFVSLFSVIRYSAAFIQKEKKEQKPFVELNVIFLSMPWRTRIEKCFIIII